MAPLFTILILSHPIIAFSLASNLSFINGVAAISKQRDFDYFVLSLQWPPTNCRETHKCCNTNACCRRSSAPKKFTIHGLWPDYKDGGSPSCCTNSEFDMKEISTLRNALDEHWPSLSCSSPSTCHGHKGSFWAHEWEKHGTCAYPVVRDEYDYFRTTLNLYFKYNVTKVLIDAGYIPSNSEKYPLRGIIFAIENVFHMTPFVVCSDGALEELRLCFNKDLKPRDCVITSSIKEVVDYSRSSCPKYVSLPSYASSGRLLQVEHKGWILALFVIAICFGKF